MRKTPTDLQILEAIYDRYYDEFAAFDQGETKSRGAKILVPINIDKIAASLGVDGDIIFGRLHYDLEKRFGYKRDDGSWVTFFAMAAGRDRHVVNFPYLASVLANLREQNKQFRLATGIAIFSLVISAISLTVSFLT